jgi:hypothetical protein
MLHVNGRQLQSSGDATAGECNRAYLRIGIEVGLLSSLSTHKKRECG